MITGSTRSIGRRMGIAALIVGAGVLLSRILGQVRDIIFAAMLGADGVTDEYVAAFALPDFLNYLLAGGFLSITFIPIFSRYLERDDEEGGWEALTAILRPLAVGIVALTAIGWVVAPVIIEALFPDFDTAQVAATVRFTRIVLPAQIFFVLGALFTAVQYAKGVFTIPTLAPIIYNLGIIAGGVLYAWSTGDPDPEGFIWGALTGAFLGNFALQWWGARRVGMRLVSRVAWNHPALREYVLIALPLMIGQSIVVLDETFMRVFGNMVGEGVQTQLQYARRTMLVPVGIIAQAAGVAAYPFLARLFAAGRRREMADTVDRALRYVLVISLAAAGILAATTVPVIRALFERSAFEPADTLASAEALLYYSFAIPIWGALQILSRAFYARIQMWTPVLIGTGAAVIAVPLYIGLRSALGIGGVALASTLSLGLYTLALGVVWYRSIEGWNRIQDVLRPSARALPLIVAGAVVAWFTTDALGDALGEGFVATVVVVVAAAVVFVAVVVLAASGITTWWDRDKNRPPVVPGGR